MPKTNINTIFKKGSATKVETIDYRVSQKKRELIQNKEKSEAVLKSKDINVENLMSFIFSK